jgi:hypothetical protein
MNFERTKFLVEMAGITAVVGSLLLVAYELKQTRDMNMSELHFNRMSLFHSRMTAHLESEAMLAVWEARGAANWDEPDLTPMAKAAAFINANGWIAEWEADYRYIELGFTTRDLEGLKVEIRQTIEAFPEMTSAWEAWRLPIGTDYPFNLFMEGIFADALMSDPDQQVGLTR